MQVLVEVLVRDSEKKQVLVDKFWEAPGLKRGALGRIMTLGLATL
jgi:hypothetical protein